MNDNKMQVIEKISIGLENELKQALNDFRRLQNGANVHHMANALCKVQVVLNAANEVKQTMVAEAFHQMKNLSGEHSKFFEKVDESLRDGTVTKDEYDALEAHVEEYKKRLDDVLKTLRVVR